MKQEDKLNILVVICIFIALLILLYTYLSKNKNLSQKPGQEPQNGIVHVIPNKKDTSDILPSSDKKVRLNYPIALSYKSKEDIFALRKKYVAKSIFSIPNYEPSQVVFGQIVSEKPWYSINICRDLKTNLPVITGPSEESRFINNPTMLVALEYPFLWSNMDNNAFCNSSVNQLIPIKISYSSANNEISVKYSELPFDAVSPFFYQFNGLNANDLGYRYAYVDLEKSTLKLKFSDYSNNLSTDVQEFQNFIHLGSSCRHNGGCNNGSPRQPFSEFNYNKGDKGGEIYIKLWRQRPLNKNMPGDINERIIIEK